MRSNKERVKQMFRMIVIIIAVFILPLVLLFTDVQITAFDRAYYEKEYIKYNIPQSIGIEMPELMNSTDKLLSYLNGERQDLNFQSTVQGKQTEFFTQRDKIHMVDVKGLFIKGRAIRNIGLGFLALFLAYICFTANKNAKLLPRIGIAAFIAGIIPVILLIILMNLDFYKYFTIFHQIFFSNDFWLLDPAVDRLVNIYPQEFFSDMAFKIAYLYISELTAILIASLVSIWRTKKFRSS